MRTRGGAGENLKVAGVIAEYNPFHNGHSFHLRETRSLTGAETVVAVMSGDFAQRGEAAFWDKWTRARIAVENGADLVLELPFVYACNNAEYFAKGAVRLLDRLGCVTHVSFGSECGDLAQLSEAAEIILREPESFRASLKAFSGRGCSFPKARCEALRELAGTRSADLLKQPNNILAIEYLKQLILTGSDMRPVTVRRRGAEYAGKNDEARVAGASALRKLFLAGKSKEALAYLPEKAANLLSLAENRSLAASQSFYQMVAYALRTKEAKELSDIFSASEGLENRAKAAVEKAVDMESLVAAIKSKRYTETRIKRFLLHALFGFEKGSLRSIEESGAAYGRVLALNGRGARVLRRIKDGGDPSFHVITNLSKSRQAAEAVWPSLRYDVLASDLYNLAKSGEMREDSDYRKKPFVKID
jgi:predicted nucleotidyltransferase